MLPPPKGGCPFTLGSYACSAASFAGGTNSSQEITGFASVSAAAVLKCMVIISCGFTSTV